MSDYTAIAGVSRSLKRLLMDRMVEQVDVTVGPPDVEIVSTTNRRVNLYLYHLQENSALKNQEIPGQGHPGDYGHPPLSLILHYLLTVFSTEETGSDVDMAAQQTLGDAMRVLHDYAILTQDMHITRLWAGPLNDPILDASLQNEFEKVKITMSATSLEEFSKLWMALPNGNFRRSAAYEVSVVQIESRQARQVALPVRTRAIQMTLLQRPEITAVYRKPALVTDSVGDPRAAVGQTLVIEGAHFAAQKTWVRMGSLEPLVVLPLSDTRIEIAIPDKSYPVDADHTTVRPIPDASLLQPGPQLVDVQTSLATESVEGGLEPGATVAGQRVLGSNQSVFMLVPRVTGISPGSGAASATTLTLTGTRLFQRGKSCYVLIGDTPIEVLMSPTGAIRSVLLGDVPVEMAATATDTGVSVALTGLGALLSVGQTYPVRMQVNGAQSLDAPAFQLTGI